MAALTLMKILIAGTATPLAVGGATGKKSKKKLTYGELDVPVVVELYARGLVSFLTKKNTEVRPRPFLELIKRQPEVAWQLASAMVGGLTGALNDFRRMQCVTMLQMLLQHKPSLAADAGKLASIRQPLQTQLAQQLAAGEGEAELLTSARLKTLLKFVLFLARLIKATDRSDTARLDKELLAALLAVSGREVVTRAGAIKNLLRQILLLSGQDSVQGAKPQTEGSDLKQRKRKRQAPAAVAADEEESGNEEEEAPVKETALVDEVRFTGIVKFNIE